MKKLLGIIILSLFCSNIGFADILKFSKCYSYQNDRGKTDNTSFDSNFLEKSEFTINFNTGTILFLNILTEQTHQKQKAAWIKSGNSKKYGGTGSQKQTMARTTITHYDEERVYASSSNDGTITELNINLITGEVFTEMEFDKPYRKFWVIHKCISPSTSDISKATGPKIASGTAFFINSKGNLLTNNHVVEGCVKSKISYFNKDYDAQLIATDKNLDLALLKVNLTPKSYLNFSNELPKKLQKIYVAGFPFGKGLSDDLKISSGIVSSLKGMEDNSNELQVDAPINNGNSGGPIVGNQGELIAIAVSGLAKELTEGISFGIKSSAAANFLSVNGISATVSKTSTLINNDKLLKILEESTVYTYCEIKKL